MQLNEIRSSVPDFRLKRRCLHALEDIFGLTMLGVIANGDDFSEIDDVGVLHLELLRADDGLIFRRVSFRKIRLTVFFGTWIVAVYLANYKVV